MTKIPRVPVELDRTRHLVVDLNAIDVAEELTGRNLLDLAAWRDLDGGALKRLIYACLLRDDEDTRKEGEEPLTLEAVGAMLHPGNLRTMLDALLAAARGSFPEPEEEEDGDEDEEDDDEANPPEGPSPPP